jgi:hypothetical protein
MTLVHAIWFDDSGFDVYADTLVSGDGIKLSSRYTKLLVLPVKYRSKGDEQVYSFELGMAIAGGVVVCTAIYGLLSSLLQNLRSFEVERPPLFDEIVELVENVARTVRYDSAPMGEAGEFVFMLMGIEQTTGYPRWKRISGTEEDGLLNVSVRDFEIFNGACHSIGSAGDAYSQHLQEQRQKQFPDGSEPSRLFYRFVMSRKRKDIGGGISHMRVDQTGARLVPLLVFTDEGNVQPKIAGEDANTFAYAGEYMTISTIRRVLAGTQKDVPVPEFIPYPPKRAL